MATHADNSETPEVIARAQAGDQEAFAELVRGAQVKVRAVARAVLGEAAEADDAAQEAFLRA